MTIKVVRNSQLPCFGVNSLLVAAVMTFGLIATPVPASAATVIFSVDSSADILDGDIEDLTPAGDNVVEFVSFSAGGWDFDGTVRYTLVAGGVVNSVQQASHTLTLTDFTATNTSGATDTVLIRFAYFADSPFLDLPAGTVGERRLEGSFIGAGGGILGPNADIFEWVASPLMFQATGDLDPVEPAGGGAVVPFNFSETPPALTADWNEVGIDVIFKLTLDADESLNLPGSGTVTLTTADFVPEPSSLFLVTLGALSLARRRR